MNPTDAELDERERRLQAELDDAIPAYRDAKARIDRIGSELRELLAIRRERAAQKD